MAIKDIFDVAMELPSLLTFRKESAARPDSTKDSLLKLLERNAEKYTDKPAIQYQDQVISWGELNARTNQYAVALAEAGIGVGDSVAVYMENRPEFLITVFAVTKLRAIAALMNNNLRGTSLVHCINVTKSKMLIFGAEGTEAIAESRGEFTYEITANLYSVPDGDISVPEWATNLTAASSNLEEKNLPQTQDITIGDTALYIFTSGTTGLPKAAISSHRRLMQAATLSHIVGLKCKQKDRIYLCLPLYHGTGGVIGVGAALSSGACMCLRRRFSASKLLDDLREQQITCMIYVGELCRYLFNTPAKANDADTPLRSIMGNGLRPDIWRAFKSRFGIKRICEIYAASEGNAAFGNILNRDETIGTTTADVALINYDVANDEIVRNEEGFCSRVAKHEPGLCVARISEESRFEGYTDPEATEKKILRDVFEKGDAWFNTGDLLKTIDVGFALNMDHYQFVDRIGDTFRWRSENVSTNEVGELLNSFDQIEIANVFGVNVPNAEGRAGMVALQLKEGISSLDIERFAAHVNDRLPPYAVPVFVRVQTGIEVTGTFKMVKKDLVKENYDISQFEDPVFVMKPRTNHYERLDSDFLKVVQAGNAGY